MCDYFVTPRRRERPSHGPQMLPPHCPDALLPSHFIPKRPTVRKSPLYRPLSRPRPLLCCVRHQHPAYSQTLTQSWTPPTLFTSYCTHSESTLVYRTPPDPTTILLSHPPSNPCPSRARPVYMSIRRRPFPPLHSPLCM